MALVGTGTGQTIDLSNSQVAKACPVAPGQVVLVPGYLDMWRSPMLSDGIAHQWEQLVGEGMIERLALAAKGNSPRDPGSRFAGEARLYKWLEAVCYRLAEGQCEQSSERYERAVALVTGIVADDGYVGLTFPQDRCAERWQVRPRGHELFAAGHLIQAAITAARTLGDERLLVIATGMASLIGKKAAAGELAGYRDHPGCELALIELYRHTGNKAHLQAALDLIEMISEEELGQVRGHAVCLAYFACALVDAYLETGERRHFDTAKRLWDDAIDRNSYITGAVGGRVQSESFGRPFELPHEGAYAESCASIGMVMWAQRMLAATGQRRYSDHLELCLYNAVLAGVSLDGNCYFYDVPQALYEPETDPPWREYGRLAGSGLRQREPWFFERVACCPPNLARVLAQLPGYLFGRSERSVWIHLYAPSRLADDRGAVLTVATGYPYCGVVKITVDSSRNDLRELRLRIPAWAGGEFRVRINNIAEPATAGDDGYLVLRRGWRSGDRIELEFGMPVEHCEANPRLIETRGQRAIKRGPLVYCLEGIDNPGIDLRDMECDPDNATVSLGEGPFESTLIEISGRQRHFGPQLYRPVGARGTEETTDRRLRAIPFALWGNRGPSQMAVWTSSPIN